MKIYQYVAEYSLPGMPVHVRKGTIEADSEDQACDYVFALMEQLYGWLNYVSVAAYEVEA